MLAHVSELLRARREHVAPRIAEVVPGASVFELREKLLIVRWPLREGGALVLAANLGDADASASFDARLLYSTPSASRGGHMAPWQVRLLLQP